MLTDINIRKKQLPKLNNVIRKSGKQIKVTQEIPFLGTKYVNGPDSTFFLELENPSDLFYLGIDFQKEPDTLTL